MNPETPASPVPSSFSSDYSVQTPAPVVESTPQFPPSVPTLEIPLVLSNDSTMPVVGQKPSRKKRWLSYPLLWIVLLFAGVVLAGQQYGLWDILPYPLSGLIAAGLVVLVALWMIARGWLGKILSVIWGLVSLWLVAYMITDVVSPGLLPVSGTWNISFSYEQEPGWLSLHVATTWDTVQKVIISPITTTSWSATPTTAAK